MLLPLTLWALSHRITNTIKEKLDIPFLLRITLIVFSEKDKEYFLSKNDLSLLYLKPVLLASLTIKSSKLGGVLLGKDCSFRYNSHKLSCFFRWISVPPPSLDIVRRSEKWNIKFLNYTKDDEGRGLSLLISLYWHLCPYLFGGAINIRGWRW